MAVSQKPAVTVVGAGLAGCEAALQLARFGLKVRLLEMRPEHPTPAHESGDVAEIVCSNSLKSTILSTASGLLKAELGMMGCRLLECAQKASVPAGSALAVDKKLFSKVVEKVLENEPLIQLERVHLKKLPIIENHNYLLATGPLTSPELINQLGQITGQPSLHFFDAIAPTVTADSLDTDILFRAARYGKGDSDYWNSPLNEAEYQTLYQDLMDSEKAEVHDFDRAALFDGCQPIEEIAASGPQSMAFGPMRPVGLKDPRTGNRPHAVIQLRQENSEATLFGLVGFQTRLKFGEQKRVFRKIPGLAKAEFVRFGQMHRNFFLDTPRCLKRDFSLPERPDIFIAGQMTGVEGYVESIASGLLTAWKLAARASSGTLSVLPAETIVGGLLSRFLFDKTSGRFSPMNANFGIVPDLGVKVRGKKERKEAKSQRSIEAMEKWLEENDPGR
ncbi:MAG: methylenetetrahydrofolate--tRNA-(uracil(54)-C(5))-methyltransferase (FADH(2)-oxidizing) TrmFO [bacterium]|nr:methylenetetrahydrofolate--tRNA-(uracil(54)-C(5))-methyltransferase (FADH(2)-oxidizing) TrmFO [bacterium]